MRNRYGPTARFFIISILGTILFSVMSYNLLTTRHTDSTFLIGEIFSWIIILFFLGVAMGAFYYILTFKIVYLDDFGITIKYPILFRIVKIKYEEIRNKNVTPQVIKYSARGSGGPQVAFEGDRIEFEYGNNKTIEINSFSQSGFDELCEILIKKKKLPH